jgi:hypothetical protein
MNKNNVTKFLWVCLVVCLIVLPSCNKDMAMIAEPQKSIAGTWKISGLTRNAEDLTLRMDLSTFRIIFNTDNTYTLQGQFPFIVNESGTYSLDDPQYPMYINFQEQNATAVKLSLDFPIVNGERHIKLVISPGCSQNSYEYSLEKAQ